VQDEIGRFVLRSREGVEKGENLEGKSGGNGQDDEIGILSQDIRNISLAVLYQNR
jgi:hypothetical protein